MRRENINPAGLFQHPSFTRIVTVSGAMRLIFISGQTPTDENYKAVAEGDYAGQYRQVMENLGVQLRAAGATWDDVVYRRVFTLDVDALIAALRAPEARGYWNAETPPGSTLVGVTRLSDPAFLVEIDVQAVVAAD